MLILSIESSCDETAAAITEDGRRILSDCIESQIGIHAEFGGVVPEIASRRHIEVIDELVRETLRRAAIDKCNISAIAVTYTPGLIGALLVGVNYAKAAAYALGVPLIGVHHIRGHIAANYPVYTDLVPPFMSLVVSGGHSLIIDVEDYTRMRVIGGSRDDAAGECFDKTARLLGLGYPGGAIIDELSISGNPERYKLPRGKIAGYPYEMSFSGLKTAAANLIRKPGSEIDTADMAASLCAAVSDTLVPRAVSAAKAYRRNKLCLAGGVAANSWIRKALAAACLHEGIELFTAPKHLCSDNAAMIGCQGYYEYLAGYSSGYDLNAYAVRSVDEG